MNIFFLGLVVIGILGMFSLILYQASKNRGADKAKAVALAGHVYCVVDVLVEIEEGTYYRLRDETAENFFVGVLQGLRVGDRFKTVYTERSFDYYNWHYGPFNYLKLVSVQPPPNGGLFYFFNN